jgi:pyrroloquinoline-quinone synthase
VTTIRGIDRRIARRHLLKHPFYQAWSHGEVALDTLRSYAGQYYQFERSFPKYVAAAYARVDDPAGRRALLGNLVDEEGRDPTHPELWLRFAEGLGVPRSDIESAPRLAATRRLLGTYERHAVRGTAGSALGALYAYESIFPEVAAEKARGLAKFYGVTDERSLEFFRSTPRPTSSTRRPSGRSSPPSWPAARPHRRSCGPSTRRSTRGGDSSTRSPARAPGSPRRPSGAWRPAYGPTLRQVTTKLVPSVVRAVVVAIHAIPVRLTMFSFWIELAANEPITPVVPETVASQVLATPV